METCSKLGMSRRSPRWTGIVLAGLSAIALSACTGSAPDDPTPRESIPSQEIDPNLTFENVTLEQVGDDGEVLWIVDAERVTYSGDREVAQLEKPSGQLYRDGEFLYEVEAERGTVQQDGREIFLSDRVVVVDRRDGTVVRGERMHWQPDADRLDVTGNVTAVHENANIQAEQVVFLSEPQHLQMLGGVVANFQDPPLQLSTDRLLWQMPDELVVGDRPVQVARYEPEDTADAPASEPEEPANAEDETEDETLELPENDIPENPTLSDRATSERIRVDLANQIATLEQNARIAVVEPPLDVVSNVIDWDLSGELITSNVPLRVNHRDNQVQLSGNQGWMNLAEEVFYLREGVEVLGENSEAQLTARQLTWFVPSERFEAEGQVVYRQVDPPMQLTGPRAEGKLEERTFVVSGGDVVTEILTNPLAQ